MDRIFRKLEAELSPIAAWSFYFLFKFYLFIKGSINLDIIENLLFLVFIIIPMPKRISRYKSLRIFRGLLNILLAIILLWRDSWFPPFFDAISFLREQGMPSFLYIVSFLKGFYSISLVIVLILSLLISIILRKYQKYKIVTAALFAVLIIIIPVINKQFEQSLSVKHENQSSPKPIDDPSRYIDSFYNNESERLVMFHPPDKQSIPFDIVILHISSLSWDDLREIGITQEDPFFKQFDYLFTNFNCVVNYDKGAVMRLLQSNCGQKSDNEINKDELPDKPCLLSESLLSVGYKLYVGMDHNGSYGDYAKVIKKNGMNNAVEILPNGLNKSAIFIDDKTPLYSDYAILKKWFDAIESLSSERALLYYNSIVLHEGSHIMDDKQWALKDKRDQYKDMFSTFIKDINQFIDLLKTSKRNTVLIIVPEYGRHLSVNLDAALKDIPLPKITMVPVAVKLIGAKFNNLNVIQHVLSKPASYLAVSWILSKFVENSPFGKTSEPPDGIVFKIPKTNFVSDYQGSVVIDMDGKYLFYGQDKKWAPLIPEQLK